MCTKDISLKAACADTFHYPNDWNPTRGTLDEYQRKKGFEHHFGKNRTKNLDKGMLLIRFEMPFNVQCLRCQSYIGQGTRYDADKKKVDKYFSTPIYEFLMRCHQITGPETSADHSLYCNQRFCIRTDPQNSDYAILEGLRRKNETWTPGGDTGTVELLDPETRRQMNEDPMVKAEHTIRDKQRERSQKQRLDDLIDLQDEREDTYALNCVLRRGNREKRKQEQAEAAAAEAEAKIPKNFAFPLVDSAPSDIVEAKAVDFRTDHDRIATAARRAAVRAAPLLKRGRNDKGAAAAAQLLELSVKRQKLSQHARMARLFSAK